jgi:hypothetical protein
MNADLYFARKETSALILSKRFWQVLVKPSVVPFLILALIDCGLTVYGTAKALGGPMLPSLIVGLVVGAGVLITLLSTFDIWGSWHPVLQESPRMTQLLRSIWGVVFLYDWFTSIAGIQELSGLNRDRFELVDGLIRSISHNWAWLMRFLAIVVGGLVVCGSTLVVSFMAYNERREDVPDK